MLKCKLLICISLIGTSILYSAPTRISPPLSDELRFRQSEDLPQWRQFDLGRRLGKSLAKGSAVFVGTIRAVDPRVIEGGSTINREAPYRADVMVTVDQWLSGDVPSQKADVRLELVKRPNSLKFRSDEGWSPWDGVDVQVNNRLLVVYDSTGDDQANSTNIRLLISDQNLFQAVRDSVILDTMLAKNPDEILRAPTLLSTRKDSILAGYIISYLTDRVRPNSVNTDALVLSNLFRSNTLSSVAWLPIRMTLTHLLSSEHYPVTEETRETATQALIVIGCANDAELAKQAVTILVVLSDRKKINMRPLLNEEQRKALNRIYRSAFSKDSAHPNFVSQLGPAAR